VFACLCSGKDKKKRKKNISKTMDDHEILMKHYSFYAPLCDAVHKVLLEDEGNGIVWVSYTSLTTHKCLPLTLTLKDLTTLMASDGEDTAAKLFGEDHLLANTALLNKIMEELTSRPISLGHALTYFFNEESGFYYPTFFPLLNFKE
jgi:hypothetical protein